MRKALTIAAAALAAALWIAPAGAQNSSGGATQQDQGGALLPPSTAVKLAVEAMPGAEALGVKLRGQTYVVKLKLDGTITQVAVDAVTGEVTQQ